MKIEREKIIQAIENRLKNNPLVFAFWLEGADSTNTVDQYSDIDIWLDVKDHEENKIFEEIEKSLLGLGELDFSYKLEHPHPQIMHKVYHLRNTPKSLLLDVCIQSHSRNFEFVKNLHDVPKIIFNREGIKFREFNKSEFKKDLQNRVHHLKNTFKQQSRVATKIQRGEFLEAIAYYMEWVIKPLVELLRIKHIPRKRDYYFKHISRDLPKKVVEQLENLVKVQSIEDIKKRIPVASTLFEKTLKEIKERSSVGYKEAESNFKSRISK